MIPLVDKQIWDDDESDFKLGGKKGLEFIINILTAGKRKNNLILLSKCQLYVEKHPRKTYKSWRSMNLAWSTPPNRMNLHRFAAAI